jgi:hypothetical protein
MTLRYRWSCFPLVDWFPSISPTIMRDCFHKRHFARPWHHDRCIKAGILDDDSPSRITARA